MKERYKKPLYEWTEDDITTYVAEHIESYCDSIPPGAESTYSVPYPVRPTVCLFADSSEELVTALRKKVEESKSKFANHISDGIDAAAK